MKSMGPDPTHEEMTNLATAVDTNETLATSQNDQDTVSRHEIEAMTVIGMALRRPVFVADLEGVILAANALSMCMWVGYAGR